MHYLRLHKLSVCLYSVKEWTLDFMTMNLPNTVTNIENQSHSIQYIMHNYGVKACGMANQSSCIWKKQKKNKHIVTYCAENQTKRRHVPVVSCFLIWELCRNQPFLDVESPWHGGKIKKLSAHKEHLFGHHGVARIVAPCSACAPVQLQMWHMRSSDYQNLNINSVG